MNKKYILKLTEKYEDLSYSIMSAWKIIIGPGCGYFDSWSILDDNTIKISYYRPRNGGLDFDYISIDDILNVLKEK
jgi:hypothetical protein